MERASTSQIPQSVGKQGEALRDLGIYMAGLLSKVKEGRPINLSIQEKQELHNSYQYFSKVMGIFLQQESIRLPLLGQSVINDIQSVSSYNCHRTNQIEEIYVEQDEEIILGSLFNNEEAKQKSRMFQKMQLNQNSFTNILNQINNKGLKDMAHFSIYSFAIEKVTQAIEESKSDQEKEKQKAQLQRHLLQIEQNIAEQKVALVDMIKRIETQKDNLVKRSGGLMQENLDQSLIASQQPQQEKEEEVKSAKIPNSLQADPQNFDWVTAAAQKQISLTSHRLRFNNDIDYLMRKCEVEMIYGNDNKNVEVMNLKSLATTNINILQKRMANCQECSDKSHLLISNVWDQTALIIDREEGKKEIKEVDLKSFAWGMLEWDDQNIIFGLQNGELRMFDLPSSKTTLLVKSQLGSIYDIVKCKRGGGYLAMGGIGGVKIGIVGNDFTFHSPPNAKSSFCEGKLVPSLIAFGENQLCAAVLDYSEELMVIVNVEEGTETTILHPSNQKDFTWQLQLVDRSNGVAIVRTWNDLFLLNLDSHQITHLIQIKSYNDQNLGNSLKIDTETNQFYLQIFIIEDGKALKRLDLKRNLHSF